MFAPLIDFIECQTLYNMLNEGVQYAKINDRYYLYLLGRYWHNILDLHAV